MTRAPNNDVAVLLPTEDIWAFISDMYMSFCSIHNREGISLSSTVHQMWESDYSHLFWLLHLSHSLGPGISLFNKAHPNIKHSAEGPAYYDITPFLPSFCIRSIRTKSDVIISDHRSIIEFLTSN